MISFSFQDKTKDNPDATNVWIGVHLPDISRHPVWFKFDAQTQWGAALLKREIANELYADISSIRRIAYDSGWKDAKEKKAKRKIFSGFLGG